MIDRIENHPTVKGYNKIDLRSGKDRRKGYSMVDPDLDRRKGERRKSDDASGDPDLAWRFLADSVSR